MQFVANAFNLSGRFVVFYANLVSIPVQILCQQVRVLPISQLHFNLNVRVSRRPIHEPSAVLATDKISGGATRSAVFAVK